MRKFKVLVAGMLLLLSTVNAMGQVSYKINATGQTLSYNEKGEVINNPKDGEKLYGQDASYLSGETMNFVDNGDGTVCDQNTGLMWQQTPPIEGMTWYEAKEYCENLEFGGYSDWRLPTLKELFSISNFEQGWPYIDMEYFNLAGDVIGKDQQYWAANKYLGVTVEGGDDAAFGVNHVTGHIKAYPAGGTMSGRSERPQSNNSEQRPQMGEQGNRSMPPPPNGGGQMAQGGQRPQGGQGSGGGRPMGNPMAKQVRAVRGEIYGENNFVDNGDGTVSDLATGLMWAKADNGKGIEWIEALPYAEGATLAGHSDWRLPNVKELQSIVDYTRAPISSRVEAAIDPTFSCTPFVNEAGDDDYGYYWSSTSACFTKGQPFYFAWYVAFGRAVNDQGADFHGAGAVRFDSKTLDVGGVQGDEERYYNFVRLVRDIN